MTFAGAAAASRQADFGVHRDLDPEGRNGRQIRSRAGEDRQICDRDLFLASDAFVELRSLYPSAIGT